MLKVIILCDAETGHEGIQTVLKVKFFTCYSYSEPQWGEEEAPPFEVPLMFIEQGGKSGLISDTSLPPTLRLRSGPKDSFGGGGSHSDAIGTRHSL